MSDFNSIVIGRGILDIEISSGKGSDSIAAYDGDRYVGELVLSCEMEKKIEELEKKVARALGVVNREIEEYGNCYGLPELLNILEEKE